MGIQVHKRIGYAVDNIKWDKIDKYHYKINDPRIDTNKFYSMWSDNLDVIEWSSCDFVKWCDSNKKAIYDVARKDLMGTYLNDDQDENCIDDELSILSSVINSDTQAGKEIRDTYLYDTYICTEEGGIKEVFLTSPISCVR